MTIYYRVADKVVADVDWRYLIWCSLDGTNDGSAGDEGKLQGETISAANWAVDSGSVTISTSSTAAVTIQGVTYALNTVAAVRFSGGTAGQTQQVSCTITTSGGRIIKRGLQFEAV